MLFFFTVTIQVTITREGLRFSYSMHCIKLPDRSWHPR